MKRGREAFCRQNALQKMDGTITLEELAKQLTANKKTSLEKAKALFDWMQDYFVYDYEYAKNPVTPPRPLQQVFDQRKGICSELAIAYVLLARHAGLEANYVNVFVDHNWKPVNHACAEVVLRD